MVFSKTEIESGTTFKKNPFENRKSIAADILKKYSDKIPVILECKGDISLKKYKFIINKSADWSYFLMIIRKFVELKQEEAIFTFVGNTIPAGSETIGNIYNKNKDVDGFLYCMITKENTFG